MTREVLNKRIKTLSSLVLATDVKWETLYNKVEVETQAMDGKDLTLIGLAIGQAQQNAEGLSIDAELILNRGEWGKKERWR